MREIPEDWKKAKVTFIFQKGPERESREVKVGQPVLDPRKGDGANHPGKHFQTYDGQEGDWV